MDNTLIPVSYIEQMQGRLFFMENVMTPIQCNEGISGS